MSLFRRKSRFWFKTGHTQKRWIDWFNREYARDNDMVLGA